MNRTILALAVLLAGLALAGCYGQVQRTLTIDSEPPGARCWLNHNEVGRTPYVPYHVKGTVTGVRPTSLSLSQHRAPGGSESIVRVRCTWP